VTHTYPAVGVYTAIITATSSVSQLTATTTVAVAKSSLYICLPLLLRSGQ
jgi:hypothetical protein